MPRRAATARRPTTTRGVKTRCFMLGSTSVPPAMSMARASGSLSAAPENSPIHSSASATVRAARYSNLGRRIIPAIPPENENYHGGTRRDTGEDRGIERDEELDVMEDSLDAATRVEHVEVDEEADMVAGELRIGEDLSSVDGDQRVHALDLYDYRVLNH